MARAKTFITGKLKTALLKARDRILAEPLRLDMQAFVSREREEAEEERMPRCGTVGCIAGWAHLSSFSVRQLKTMPNEKFGRLDLAAQEWFERELAQQPAMIERFEKSGYHSIQHMVDAATTSTIYNVSGWPETFKNRYRNAKSPAARASATAARIVHFINTGK